MVFLTVLCEKKWVRDRHPVRRVLRGSIGRYQDLSSIVSDGQDVRCTSCSTSLTSVFPVRRTSCPSRFLDLQLCRAAVVTDWKPDSYSLLCVGSTVFPAIAADWRSTYSQESVPQPYSCYKSLCLPQRSASKEVGNVETASSSYRLCWSLALPYRSSHLFGPANDLVLSCLLVNRPAPRFHV